VENNSFPVPRTKPGPKPTHGWQKGQSGNPLGRPKKPEIEQLRKALAEAKKENNNLDFLTVFVNKAYTDEKYAIALFKKIIPAEAFITKRTERLTVNFKGKLDKNNKPTDVELVSAEQKPIEVEEIKENGTV